MTDLCNNRTTGTLHFLKVHSNLHDHADKFRKRNFACRGNLPIFLDGLVGREGLEWATPGVMRGGHGLPGINRGFI